MSATGSLPTSTYMTSPGLRSVVLATSYHRRSLLTLQRLVRLRDAVESRLEHLQSEQRAFHSRRANRHAQLFQYVVAADRLHFVQRPALHHLSQDRSRCLTDRATPTRKTNVGNPFAVSPGVDANLVAAQWIDVLEGKIRWLESPLVPWIA